MSPNDIEHIFPSFDRNDAPTESLVSSRSIEIKNTFDFETTTEINLNNIIKYKEVTTFKATAKPFETFIDGTSTNIHQMTKNIEDKSKSNSPTNVNMNNDPNGVRLEEKENAYLKRDGQTKDVRGNKIQAEYLNNPLIINETWTSLKLQTSRGNRNVKKKESTLRIIVKHIYLLWWLLPIIVLWFWILLYRLCKSSS